MSEHRRLEDISVLPEPLGAEDYFFIDELLFSIVHSEPGRWVLRSHSSHGMVSEVGDVVNGAGAPIADVRAGRTPTSRENLHDAIRDLVTANPRLPG